MNDELKSQLTAWALDELPPDEEARIAESLAESVDAQTYADETREFCSLLKSSLGGAEAELTPEQRLNLTRQLASPTPIDGGSRSGSRRMLWAIGIGAAATLVTLWQLYLMRPGRPDVAVLDRPPGGEGRRRATGSMTGAETEWGEDRGTAFREALKDESRPESGTPPTVTMHDYAETESLSQAVASEEKAVADGDLDLATKAGRPLEASRTGLERMQTLGERRLKKADVGRETPEAIDGLFAKNEKSADALSNQPAGGPEPESLRGANAALGLSVPAPGAPAALPTTADKLADAPAEGIADTRFRTGGLAGGIPAGAADAKTKLSTDPEPAATAVPSLAAGTAGRLGGGGGQGGPLAKGAELADEAAGFDAAADKPLAQSVEYRKLSEAKFKSAVNPIEESKRYYFHTPQPENAAKESLAELSLLTKPGQPGPGGESYGVVPENGFKPVASEPVSTFSIDVDTASYANVRRFLNLGQRPPAPAVRLEEVVNYFRYDYPPPSDGRPFSVNVDLADCPWKPEHRLARIGLKAREVNAGQRPPSNLVFLVDVSGSMNEANKLPLVKQSLQTLGRQLTEKDRVAMVTYAGDSGLALDSTSGSEKGKISRAIDSLAAGGSTNGGAGIQLAYQVAQAHFMKEGVNRVLLATDGDFNVGTTSPEELQTLITDKAKNGVFLSVLGYGMDNLKDSTMEMLADKGNGNYAYIDSLSEARKVLDEEMAGTLVTVAKDVKVQVEFNPAMVRSYRQIGYENRALTRQDFNDDKKDAGEIGAGHTVTALYEVVPVGAPAEVPPIDPLRYAAAPVVAATADTKPVDPAIARETMTVKLRYKAPEGTESQLIEMPVVDREVRFAQTPADFKFASAVAMYGMLLKDSAYKGSANWDAVRQAALEGKGPDPLGYRGEFLQLVEKARGVAP